MMKTREIILYLTAALAAVSAFLDVLDEANNDGEAVESEDIVEEPRYSKVEE